MSIQPPPQEMATCAKCGSQNPAKNKFCKKCGQSIAAAPAASAAPTQPAPPSKCPKCNTNVTPDARFCPGCYKPLTDHFTVEDRGEYTLITCNIDHIDFENSRDLALLMRPVKASRIVFDLVGLKSLDSIGIGALVTLASNCPRKDQELKFCRVASQVTDLFKKLNVNNVFDICPTRADCIGSWGLLSDT